MATFRKVDVTHVLSPDEVKACYATRDYVVINGDGIENNLCFMVDVNERDWLRARYSRLIEHDGKVGVARGDVVILRWNGEHMPFQVGRVGLTTALLIPLEMV